MLERIVWLTIGWCMAVLLIYLPVGFFCVLPVVIGGLAIAWLTEGF